MRCCFFSVDDPWSNCCGAMVSMRNVECLSGQHLKTAHGVDEAAYMQRVRALLGRLHDVAGNRCQHGPIINMIINRAWNFLS